MGEVVGKGGERLNMVQKMCTHVHMYINAKMIPVETIQGIGGGGNKGELWRG
jgi:hypothetical protein